MMKLYMLVTGTYTTHPHGGRKESLEKGLINLRSAGCTYAGQIRERKKKRKQQQNLSSHLWVDTKLTL